MSRQFSNFNWVATSLTLLVAVSFSGVVRSTFGEEGVPTPSTPKSEPKSDAPIYSLKYKFQPGETVRHEVCHRATSETTVSGVTQTAQTVTNSTKVWKVTEVSPKGEITFVHSVDSLRMKTRITGHTEVSWDSASNEKPPAGYEDAAKAIGVPLVIVTIDSKGSTLKREEKLEQKNGESKTNQIVIPLPSESVAVGAEWNAPFDLDLVGEGNVPKRTKMRQHFELKSVKDNIAEITVDTQLLTPTENPRLRAQLAQKLSRGTIRFDIKAGRAISQAINWDERVIGFAGAESSMKFVALFEEKIATGAERTARTPAPVVNTTE